MLRLLAALLMAWTIAPAPRNGARQTPPPATDVFVASLSRAGDAFRLETPENISKSPGYDNQPFFAPDGSTLYFTSDRTAGTLEPFKRPGDREASPAYARVTRPIGNEPQSTTPPQPQMEIYRYEFATRRIARVTSTPESEYSPTVTPDGQHISVIRVEADGTQRLWKFGLDGRNPSLVLPNVKPVGYHAWLDEDTVVLFVLGQPATLQVADVRTGSVEVVTGNIGQSIQKMPGGGVSFVQQAGDGEARRLTIVQVTREDGKVVTKPLTDAVTGARQAHVAWTPDGTLLMANEGTLHAWKAGETGWRAVSDLNSLGLRNVTRMTVSPKGDRLALVAIP